MHVLVTDVACGFLGDRVLASVLVVKLLELSRIAGVEGRQRKFAKPPVVVIGFLISTRMFGLLRCIHH